MIKKVTKKSIAFLLMLITLISTFYNMVFATTEISSAQILEGEDCGYHLQFFDTNQNAWSYLVASFIYYESNGIQYPAYCLNKDLPGVGGIHDGDSYQVNVDEVMQDERLWRVAINSYPYQTPESMGLSNRADAYMATKQSVYCILYGTDPSTYYIGADERGVAIKNAIINLVNIGRNGTQTPENIEITANKVNGFIEDGDYYSQEYVVNSPVETSMYTITFTDGLPNGGKITDMSNTEKSTFNGNEHFKIRIPKSQMTKDLDVTIFLQAKCKTYPVFYGKSTIPGRQDYMLSFDPFGDVVGIATLNEKANTGKIQINKTDAETKEPISEVTFQLTKKDGTVVANATTNEKGVATFSGLYQSDYVLKEVSTNSKYILNTEEFNVTVGYNQTTIKDITNEHKKGNLKIYKVDKDNHKIALGNVQFDLFSEELQKVIGTYTTNVDGEIHVNDLRIRKL